MSDNKTITTVSQQILIDLLEQSFIYREQV